MDVGLNAPGQQRCTQRVAPGMAQHKKVGHIDGFGGSGRKGAARQCPEHRGILCRHLLPRGIQFRQGREQDPQEGCLDFVEAAVHAPRDLHLVLGLPAVLAQLAQTGRQAGITTTHRPAIAQGAKVLRRIETETAQFAPRARLSPLPAGAVGLGCVLDHRYARRPAGGENGRHGRHAAIQMGDDEGPGTRAYRAADGGLVEQ